MTEKKFLDIDGLSYFLGKLKDHVADSIANGKSAKAAKLEGPVHSYSASANTEAGWYRLANASASQTASSTPLRAQFVFRARTEASGAAYWQEWLVNIDLSGSNAGLQVFGNASQPFSQVRVLYEGDAESVSASGRPAIDVRLASALDSETLVEVEEVAVSGWTFAADGALAASNVPSGYEIREQGAYADGVSFAGHADYAEAAGLHYFDVNSSRTLAADSDGMKIASCTGTITVTIPSADSSRAWFWIKNSNTGSGTVTVHPETSSVYFDGASEDIVLQPKEYVMLACRGSGMYAVANDGRWRSVVGGTVMHLDGNETIGGVKTFTSTIQGSVSGNAGTADAFSSAQTVALTGDITGTASSTAGWSVAATLADTGVAADTYGGTAQQEPTYGGTFTVPYVTVDSKGRVTAAGTSTVKLPADTNTDTKVNVTLGTTTKAYLLGTSAAPTAAASAVEATADTGVYLDTEAGRLTAGSFAGDGQNITLGTASAAVVTDSEGRLAASSTVTAAEIGYLDGVTSSIQTQLNGKAASSHTHDASDISTGVLDAASIPNLDASKIATGTIDIERLPAGALERLVTVANQTARFALTSSDVQLGDTVRQADTGMMYYVVDASKLDSADGYAEYTAGAATSVPWTGVTGKPSSYVPESHASAGTEYGVSSASNYGHAKASSAVPSAAGTASAGTDDGTYARGDHVHPLQTTISGNAGTATKFASAQTVALTGDVTGSASSQAGWSVAATLSNSGVSADTYGPSSNASPAHSETFTVPKFTVDAKGRITSASNITVTLPASGNTDTKVTQTAAESSDTGKYPLLAKNTASASTATDTSKFAAAVTVQPSTGTIEATTFKGNLEGSVTGSISGNAASATEFASAQTVALTGDVTGSASSKAGWSVAATLSNSGVSANTYGPSANASPAHSGTFTVPKFTVDAKGRITSASDITITLPASGNTDTKVTQTAADSSDTGKYPILAKNTAATATVTDASKFASGITIQPSTGTIEATTFKGNLEGNVTGSITGDLAGNAATATEFASAQSVTLTGDVTGSASSKAGWSVAATLASTGVSADTYGPESNASPAHSGTFTVPKFTVDAKGRITSASDITITLPASGNTDTLMTQNVSTENAAYPILAVATPNASANLGAKTGIFASGIKINPSTSTVSATTFSGNATSATEFASAQPVALTGDVTGSTSSKAGWSVAATLASTGVSAATYGPSANASPAHSGTFTVPKFTVDAKGRITSASNITVTLPESGDTHYTTHLYAGASGATSNASSATSNAATYLVVADDTTARSSIKVTGTGGTTVSALNGTVTIDSPSLSAVTNAEIDAAIFA